MCTLNVLTALCVSILARRANATEVTPAPEDPVSRCASNLDERCTYASVSVCGVEVVHCLCPSPETEGGVSVCAHASWINVRTSKCADDNKI